jgi:hypothetical protein
LNDELRRHIDWSNHVRHMGVCTDHATVVAYGKVSDTAFWQSWDASMFRGIQHATSSTISIFWRVPKIAKSDYLTRHVCPSVRLSVRSHGTTRLPLDKFSWNSIFANFSKICPEYSSFFTIGHFVFSNFFF